MQKPPGLLLALRHSSKSWPDFSWRSQMLPPLQHSAKQGEQKRHTLNGIDMEPVVKSSRKLNL